MTRLAVRPGRALRQAQNLMQGVGWFLPPMLSDGALSASSSRPVTAMTGGAANTMGTWVEVVAALSADVGFVKITPASATNSSGAVSSALVNLGTGAAASETIVLENLAAGWFIQTVANQHPGWLFPLHIPRGTRVAMQCQGAEVSKAVSMRVEFFGLQQGIRPSSKIVTIGAVPASSRGTILATPGGANAEGAWTEITSATTEPFAALGVGVQGGADLAQAVATYLVDIGAGGSGSEYELVSDIAGSITGAEAIQPISQLVHPCRIPKGTRLVARNALSDIASTLDVILYGVRPVA